MPIIIYTLQGIILVTVIMMHIVRKNVSLVALYTAQSAALMCMLIVLGNIEQAPELYISAILTLVVKVVIGPWLFLRLISRHRLKHTASMYLNIPTTLLALGAMLAFAHSERFMALPLLAAHRLDGIFLAIGAFLISFFLIINRKGVLSQLIGVLSLENSIVALVSALSVQQALGLEIGIAFNIMIWIITASVLVSLIYRHFGTAQSTALKLLTD
jgi:hydrogenase-4 component E